MMFEHILLEDIQCELLCELVELERSLPREKRGKFLVLQTMGTTMDTFKHTGGPSLDGHLQDIQTLARNGLVALSYGSRGTPNFYVTPEGFQYYEELKQSGLPAERIEEEIRGHLRSADFERRFPKPFSKWKQSESILWRSDSDEQLTTVGHLCREAMQEFADALISIHQVDNAPPKDEIVARVRAVIDARIAGLGDTEVAFLRALIPYWGTVADLAQRQEHGGHREGDPLTWEDARRLVFQTLIVFFEFDRALSRSE